MQAAIKSLVDHHLQHLSDDDQANSLAEMLFNSDLFSDRENIQNIADKVTSTVKSYQFNAMALLQCIDCRAASLNDRVVSQCASIGNPGRGEALLVEVADY